ncbi:MAG: hypothetical protein INQ03_10725 [Candidatus Heimdallarchaeota archaeon]|nr:hypothetical protein [Candidatus Heimdallarchaeota archaeon]
MQPSKLKWNAIGFKRKTELLYDTINIICDEIPSEQTGKLKTPSGFKEDLEELKDKIERIENHLIPRLEQELNIRFTTPELVLLGLCQSSLKNLFESLREYFRSRNEWPISELEFDELAGSGDTSKVLALLGDAILDLAVVQIHWENSIAKVGDLTIKRMNIVSNQNLAKVCDRWGLYYYRINKKGTVDKSNQKDINHLKGTLVEAVIGIIYMEMEYEDIIRIISYLQ